MDVRTRYFTLAAVGMALPLVLGFLPGVRATLSARQTAPSQSLAGQVYTDPKGYFTIRPPAGWTPSEYSADPRGKVDFNVVEAGQKIQLKLIAAANPFSGFDEMIQDSRNAIGRVRARYDGTFSVEATTFRGQQAVLITSSMASGLRQYSIQLIAAGNYYNMAYAAPQPVYERFLAQAKASMETLEAVPKTVKPEEARAHTIASKIRLARLYMQSGRNDWALVSVNEGLFLDPANKELLGLKKELGAKQ